MKRLLMIGLMTIQYGICGAQKMYSYQIEKFPVVKTDTATSIDFGVTGAYSDSISIYYILHDNDYRIEEGIKRLPVSTLEIVGRDSISSLQGLNGILSAWGITAIKKNN
jgi:hypothetical protein